MKNALFTPDEIMLYADQFCSGMQLLAPRIDTKEDREELRLKICQALMILSQLQNAFNEDRLILTCAVVLEEFRALLLHLHWVAFHGRAVINRALFKKLIFVEAGISRLLVDQVTPA